MSDQVIVKNWGNSQGIRLSKSILTKANIKADDVLEVEAAENMIILRKPFRHRSFEERLAEFDGKIDIQEFDWGEPYGKEMF